VRNALDKALLQEGHFYRQRIVLGIRRQAPAGQPFLPLAMATIAARRRKGFKGTKALIMTGDLRNSITVVKIGKDVFVGILRSTRHRGGQMLVNIAAIHEFGSRDGKTPARPFIYPVYQKHLRTARQRFAARLRRNVGSAFGGRVTIAR
jgi:phage gpG-like protein